MNKVTVIGILCIFFAPVIIAVLMHGEWFQWHPTETRNHGELIEPPQALPEFRLPDINGQPVDRSALSGHWQLLHTAAEGCDETCLESLYWIRQVRRAQDRHQNEIGLMLVTGQTLEPGTRAAIDQLNTGIRILQGDAGVEFLALLPHRPDTPVSYILDPAAHIILRYPQGSDFNGMRRDLRRLLTWTRTDPANPDQHAPE